MSTIMKIAKMLAGNRKMAIGECVQQMTKAGTEIKVFNRGKGIFEKVVKKANGDTYNSFFGKKEGFIKMSAVNSRGSWAMEKIDPRTDFFKSTACFTAKVKGIRGNQKFWTVASDSPLLKNRDLSAVDSTNDLYRYLIKQDSNISLKQLKLSLNA